ncbi:unnamed protein product [[Candida] boidinii]|uniref:Unnamed protein product n=1 Tax=Candida boidinii TaxID=5477 RepID=A0ACB5TKZ9_CANBO|nr:unnamed protein product [[Candida] boidinii]
MSSRESRKRRHVVDSDDEEGVESKKVKTENDDTYDENQDESETRTKRRKEHEDGDRDQQETEEDDFQLPDYYPLTSQVRTDIIRFSVDKEMMHLDRLVSDIQKELKDDILGYINNKLELENAILIHDLATDGSGNGDEGTDSTINKKGNNLTDLFAECKEKLFKNDLLKESKSIYKSLLDYDQQCGVITKSFRDMKSDINERVGTIDVPLELSNLDQFKNIGNIPTVTEILEKATNTNEKEASNNGNSKAKVKDLISSIYVSINPESQIPTFNDDKDGDNNNDDDDDDDDDDDIEIEGGIVSLKCPISQQIIETPVKSGICGHTYDKKSIMELLNRESLDTNIKRCPECHAELTVTDLVKDNIMSIRLDAFKRDQQLLKNRKKVADDDFEEV